MRGPTQYLPFEKPATTRVPAARAALSPEERESLNSLITHFNADNFKLPSPLGPTALTDVERCYWSEEQFLRVLRATKWNRKSALNRALETANWRRDFGVEELSAETIEKEALSGKEIVLGFDNEQRPVLYLVSFRCSTPEMGRMYTDLYALSQHPNRQNTAPSHKHIEFVVWCLEVSLPPPPSPSLADPSNPQRTIDLLPASNPAIDTICLAIDLKASRDDGAKAPPIAIGEARQVLHVLQTFYCERLGRAVCVRVPSLFWLFFKVISPFVDPVTKEKIRFNEDARKVRLYR